jgi:myosin-5
MQVKYISNIVQAPRTSRASLVKGRSQANAVAQQALIAHWQSIVKSLNSYLKTMKANNVSYNSIEDVITTMELFSWKGIIHIDNLFFRYLPS